VRRKTGLTAGGWLMATVMSVAMMSAPPALADSNDDAFLKALKADGIFPVSDDPAGRKAVVGWAHWVCDQLGRGTDHHVIVQWLEQYLPGGPALHATFAREAAFYYCPADQPRFGW